MEKENSNWKDIEKEFDEKFMDVYFIDTLVGSNHAEAKKSYKAIKDFFKPYFQEQMHQDAISELENEQTCKGDCPNTCKLHFGEMWRCDNQGCLCHKQNSLLPVDNSN